LTELYIYQADDRTNCHSFFSFCKISRMYHNSVEKAKFRSLTRNSAAHRKLDPTYVFRLFHNS